MQPTEPRVKAEEQTQHWPRPVSGQSSTVSFRNRQSAPSVVSASRPPVNRPCPPLWFTLGCGVDVGGPTMQPREATPIWVGLTFALMIVAAIVYLTGYFMIEDILAFFK
jgi:hypothetical protein